MAGPSHQHAKSLRTVLSASARFRSDRPVKQQLRHRPAFAERDIGDMTPHSRGAFLRPGDASSRPSINKRAQGMPVHERTRSLVCK